ncbi:unnamed protein product, partial [Pocillopora meandrina]
LNEPGIKVNSRNKRGLLCSSVQDQVPLQILILNEIQPDRHCEQMASREGISGNDGTETEEFPAPSFEEQFKDLTSLISFFEECSKQTCEFIDNMKEKFPDSLKT